MDKKQFTYLIGAGASANVIPVINNFAKGLADFADYINNFEILEDSYSPALNASGKPSEIKLRLLEDISWLMIECVNHSSIDTFARKLFLSNG